MNREGVKSFALEFLSIFIAVIAAFALNNSNDNRKERKSAEKIIFEISEGLEKDLEDLDMNIFGHKEGIKACKFWRDIIEGRPRPQDSIHHYYRGLTRDFVNIQNTSGYETLKSRGLELIENDSLRTKIISLYEFDYAVLRKLEEEYSEMQFSASYYKDFIHIVSPYLTFNKQGLVDEIETPLHLPKADKQLLLAYFGKIENNRRFISNYYGLVKENILEVDSAIDNFVK